MPDPQPVDPRDVGELLATALAAHRAGRLPDAQAGYERVLAHAPGHADALHLLGVLALQRGDARAAASLIGEAVHRAPAHAAARSNLGAALQQLGAAAEALPHLERAVALQPGLADAHHNLGSVLLDLGRDAEAAAAFERAVALRPRHAASWHRLGVARARAGRHEDALTAFAEALRLQPDDADAWSNRAACWLALERPRQALADASHALALRAGSAAGVANAAAALLALQQPLAALRLLDGVGAPDAGLATQRGRALATLGRGDEALAAFDSALATDPRHAAALEARLALHLAARRWSAAATDADALQRLDPTRPFVDGRRLHALGKLCAWDGWAARRDAHLAALAGGAEVALPFSLFALTDDPALQRRAAEVYARSLGVGHRAAPAAPAAAARHGGTPAPLRVGFMSADFRDHTTSQLVTGVFEAFDRRAVSAIALSLSAPHDGPAPARLRAACDGWVDLHALADDEAAATVAAQQLDLLVDLQGFKRGHRVRLLARRPAPLQAGWLGYPGTLGGTVLDYLIADAVAVPAAAAPHFGESLVRLPHGYFPYDRTQPIDAAPVAREALGLPASGFVFCCFCDSLKFNPPLFDAWMRLLSQVDGSVLWLRSGVADDALRREAAARGIEPRRLVFNGYAPLPAYLARHAAADLFLDTFPFNGHTTSADALWAGLPVLTLQGRSFASRVASSLLHAAGLPELVTATLAGYEALALALAADPPRLASLRRRLATARDTAPLFDTAGVARRLEQAFAAMHERRRRGLPPAAIDLG